MALIIRDTRSIRDAYVVARIASRHLVLLGDEIVPLMEEHPDQAEKLAAVEKLINEAARISYQVQDLLKEMGK